MNQNPSHASTILSTAPSHANPEDNAFTIWLGAKLSAIGYDVWADVLRIKGGHDWQRKLEDALRRKAKKVLVVATPHGVQKQGVRNEIQIAYTIAQAIEDNEFIIPLRIAPFDPPFLIAQAQYIDFYSSWARGLSELLKTLEETYQVPRIRSETTEIWRDVHLRHAKSLMDEPEQLISNWLAIDRFPSSIRFFDFSSGIVIGHAQAQMDNAPWPLSSISSRFLIVCEV